MAKNHQTGCPLVNLDFKPKNDYFTINLLALALMLSHIAISIIA